MLFAVLLVTGNKCPAVGLIAQGFGGFFCMVGGHRLFNFLFLFFSVFSDSYKTFIESMLLKYIRKYVARRSKLYTAVEMPFFKEGCM